MLATFVIYLREGIEASMIVSILLAYLRASDQRRHFRDVYLGVAAAFVLITAGGVAAYLIIKDYESSQVKLYFETATYIIAAIALTGMTFWMQRHARTLSKELRARSDDALSGSARFGMAALAFQAVSREGLETMIFTLALVFAATPTGVSASHGALLLGGVLGLAVALAVAVALYRFGAKLNMGRVFRILGIVLMFFAAGLVVDAVQNFESLGWLTIGQHVLWDTGATLTQSSTWGDLAHSFLGYSDRPTALQGVVWVTYLALALTLFIRRGRQTKKA